MRPEKNLIISEIKSRVDQTPYVLLTDYTGMQVPQFNELRNRLSGANAELRVVKNTLLRRALKDSNLPDLESYLHGQSAVVMGDADISAAAKILKNFTAEFQKPKLKVGILDKAANLHVPCGKFSFKTEDIEANGRAVIEAVVRSRPATAKGRFIETCTLSSTFSPGIRIDLSPFLTA